MSQQVEVVTLEAQPAVAIRAVVPMSELDVGEMFGAEIGVPQVVRRRADDVDQDPARLETLVHWPLA